VRGSLARVSSRVSSRGDHFRAHARRPVSLRALVTHIEAGWQKHAPVLDLGLGGACIAIDLGVAAGEKVSLAFTAPTLWEPLVVRARVVWASGTSAGVAFEHKNEQAALALFELVATMGYE
jgi:hypothetical protein